MTLEEIKPEPIYREPQRLEVKPMAGSKEECSKEEEKDKNEEAEKKMQIFVKIDDKEPESGK